MKDLKKNLIVLTIILIVIAAFFGPMIFADSTSAKTKIIMSIIFVIVISIMVAGYTILKLKSKQKEIDSNNVEEKKINSLLSIFIGIGIIVIIITALVMFFFMGISE